MIGNIKIPFNNSLSSLLCQAPTTWVPAATGGPRRCDGIAAVRREAWSISGVCRVAARHKERTGAVEGDCPWRREGGFTLVEALIATAVIAITVVLATNLLLLFFRSQSESRDLLSLEGASRQILLLMSERMREGYLDYEFYTAAPSGEPEFLALRTLEGVQTVFWFDDRSGERNVYLCDDKPFNEQCDKTADPEASTDWSQVNPENTNFTIGAFAIQPDTPPYLVENVTWSDDAPFVTVKIQMQMEATSNQSPVIQTSFAPRIYVR